MADTKISELPVASALAGSEQLAVVQAGETRRVAVSGLPNPVSSLPFFNATFAGSHTAGAAFTTIPMNNIVTDTHNGWQAGTNVWTVPQTGTYNILAKDRISDGGTSGQSIGIGIDTSNADSPTFFWGVTNPNRNGIMNDRFAVFSQGQSIRLFSYIDGGNRTIEAASLTIIRVR